MYDNLTKKAMIKSFLSGLPASIFGGCDRCNATGIIHIDKENYSTDCPDCGGTGEGELKMVQVDKDKREWKVLVVLKHTECPYLYYPDSRHACMLLQSYENDKCTYENCLKKFPRY